MKIMSIFLVGSDTSFIGQDKSEQEKKSDDILTNLKLDKQLKLLVRTPEDLLSLNVHGLDGFVIFPYCSDRFSPLIYLADLNLPIIILSENETFGHALDTYEYLCNHPNVEIVFTPEELKAKIKTLTSAKWFENKICLFDAGEWRLDGTAYLKSPMFQGKLNTQIVDRTDFQEALANVDSAEAERTARKWTDEAAKILEPSFEDVIRSACVYLAMKTIIKNMEADAAYVLWCGQFTKQLGTKMCLALAKLADDGIPVGCWRGENLLPLLILHSVTKKPVFTCEAHTNSGKSFSVRHCFAPATITSDRYVLRRWRNMEHTVTAYCQLQKGVVTLINMGTGSKIVIAKGKVTDCKDLEGDNCRITVWIEPENEDIVHKLQGGEFALVYGDYAKQTRDVAEKLGLIVL